MKNRSLTSRNLLGGFCGGFLGIIAFSLLHLLLPVGCLLGVVIGFWYQEIWQGIKDGSVKTYVSWQRFYSGAIVSPRDKFKQYLKQFKVRWFDEDSITGFIYWIACLFIGTLRLAWKLVRLCVATARWPFKHPMNGVYFATAAVVLCFLGMLMRLAVPICFTLASNDGNGVEFWPMYLLMPFSFILVLPVTAAIMTAFFGDQRVFSMMMSYYSDWQRYSRYGLIYHMGYKFVEMLKVFALVFLWQVSGLAYLAFGLVAVLGFMALPIGIAKVTLRVLWRFACAKSHWPCFVTTLAVTVVSAIISRGHLHGIGLWTVAVGTGCVAGLASELVRRLTEVALTVKPSVMVFANRTCDDPIDDLLVPLWKKNYSWLYGYTVGLIPVPFES